MSLSGKQIHFMGIGGIGVSALAEMALDAGAVVSGCDRAAGPLTDRLKARGIPVFIGHSDSHARDADLLVYTSAIPPDHPERIAAGDRQEKRGQFLARFMSGREAIGVCGTHGKTTTSWLLAHMLLQDGQDPSVFIGGIAPDLPRGNHRAGTGPFVAELDESDGSFLIPRLDVGVITNIESDHLSHYRNDANLFAAFGNYAANLRDAGILVAGTDSPPAKDIFDAHCGRKLSFGFAGGSDLRGEAAGSAGGTERFKLTYLGRDIGWFGLSLPGRHNVQNAMAALGVALARGMAAESARRYLPLVRGVERRLEELGRFGGAVLYSDYAHHPTEVEASISALRRRHQGDVLVVFQPHLYSRTRDYADAFGRALALAGRVLVVDIYPAREPPIPGVTSELLVRAASRDNPSVMGPVSLDRAADAAGKMVRGCEAVVFMGAGDIDAVARGLGGRTLESSRVHP